MPASKVTELTILHSQIKIAKEALKTVEDSFSDLERLALETILDGDMQIIECKIGSELRLMGKI